MPMLDTLRNSLLGGSDGPETVRCRMCDANFSLADAQNAVDVECPFCGATDIKIRETG